MFTGIITAIGTVRAARTGPDGLDLEIAAPWADVVVGESVAVDGACLTVTTVAPATFTVHVVDTSLDRTRFATIGAGERVNLERALQVGDRLGGHIVQGHVDGVGRVVAVTDRADARIVDVEVPEAVARVSVPLGSIAVDGVSLTVISLLPPRSVRLSLIPFTLQETTLGRLAPGSAVHVEGDVIGKHVAQLMQPWLAAATPTGA
jgi:riboflavin synthase